MITIKLKCDKAIREKLQSFGLEKRRVENYLQYLTNNLINTRKWQYYELRVRPSDGLGSEYFWGEDTIHVAVKSPFRTKKERKIYFLTSLVHEYRHWVQSQIQNISESKIAYTNQDVAEMNEKYTENPLEKQCAEWERLTESVAHII